MRGAIVFVSFLFPVTGAAQPAVRPPVTAEHLPPLTTPAPIPDILPRAELRYGGTPNSMPFVLSPPGIGSSFAGPVNSSPYSTTPSSNWPPDSALPDGRDSVRGGVGSMVPNLSQ